MLLHMLISLLTNEVMHIALNLGQFSTRPNMQCVDFFYFVAVYSFIFVRFNTVSAILSQIKPSVILLFPCHDLYQCVLGQDMTFRLG